MSWLIPMLVLSVLPGPGSADANLDDLVREALERNPEVRAAELVVAAARQRPAQAQALANPMVSVTYVNDGWSPSLGRQEMTTFGIMASQDLPFPGKRALRGKVLAVEADQAEQELRRARLRIAADVKREYFAALEERALIALTGEQKGVWQQIEGVARARYSVGEASQQDVLRAQVELTRFDQVVATQTATLQTRVDAIKRLLDRAADSPLEIPESSDDDAVAIDPPHGLPEASAQSPELENGRLAVRRAEAVSDLAQRNFKPDFAVQAGYMNRGGLDAMWQAGVSVSLPIVRSRLQAAVAEALALQSAEAARLAAVTRLLAQRTQERRVQLEAAAKSVQIYRNGLIPQDRLSVESALASYRTGRVPFVTVLDALNTLYADKATLTRLVTSTRRLRVALEEASLDSRDELSAAPMGGSPAGIGASRQGDAAGMSGSMGR